MKKIISSILVLCMLMSCTLVALSPTASAAQGQVTTGTIASSALLDDLMEQYTSFILVKHKQLGGSHYSYTEAVSDAYDSSAPNGQENPFNPNSQLVLVELSRDGNNVKRTETVLLESTTGVIRDPDVSPDGTKVLFSWKKNDKADDYHLYEYDLITRSYRQLTFGLGAADTEPRYLPNGNIVFSSTRCIQTVDCWKTPVPNLYICGPNGEDIVRVGYDQVHTTYPTVTDDGRVIYTRWDYNDRTQMFVQSLFQMFPDGTNQTELFGNNSNFPTTLLHVRKVPGTSDKYMAIASGHHTRQMGKMVTIDVSKGRNNPDAVTLMFPDSDHSKNGSIDWYGQGGVVYKYPYPLNENQFLVSCSLSGRLDSNDANTPFGIYLMDTSGTRVELVPGNETYPASQIIPIASHTLFERASMVNYSSNTGTYYIGNIYEGDGLKNVPVGTAKYLRVVALDFRSYAIGDTFADGGDIGMGTADPYTPISTGNGAWDVKRVLGIVPIEADGSALFKVPSETPIYFQVLDEEGQMIQSMRSWSTLMPGETFSCVGCHEDKNMVPPAASTTTMAMAKGVQELQPDFWQVGEGYEDFDPYTTEKGFSYLDEIQPIWDENCVQCHNNKLASYDMIDAYDMGGITDSLVGIKKHDVIGNGGSWQYYKSNNAGDVPSNWNTTSFSGNWATGNAPFGNIDNVICNTSWNDTSYIWLRHEFQVDNVSDYRNAVATLISYYDDLPVIYINGHEIYSANNWCGGSYVTTKLDNVGQYLVQGKNVIAVRCQDTGGGRMIDTSLVFTWPNEESKQTLTLLNTREQNWKYLIDQQPSGNWTDVSYNDSSWRTGQAGFGSVGSQNTSWTGDYTSIWLRKSFQVSQSQMNTINQYNMRLSLDIFYDQNPVVYLNGQEIYSVSGWVNDYKTVELPMDVTDLLHTGTNVLAIKCVNEGGGAFIDSGLKGIEGFGVDFSLESNGINGPQMKKDFPLSYLVLTGSKPSGREPEWLGDASNDFISWISCMSSCAMLEPYSTGSTQSAMLQMLKKTHQGVKLSDVQLRKIMAWIDLAAPCYGDYSSGNTWDANAQRWANECDAKRAYYETMNDVARKSRALGAATVDQNISIVYRSGGTTYSNVVNFSGAKRLELPTNYKSGDTITITLPRGEKYLGLTLDNLMGEAIIYVPNGTYTFTVPSDLTPYNRTFRNGNNKTITARVVGEDELNERHNLALNPYDLTNLSGGSNPTGGYPHAITDSNYNNSSEFIVRNAIDGVQANKGHGGYPTQSWGPAQGNNHWMQVDFGREVYMDEVQLVIRADFPHDTYFRSGVLEFYDLNGNRVATRNINIEKTTDKQSFTFEPVEAASVKLTSLTAVDVNGDDWAAITEFEVYGTEDEVVTDFCIWNRDEAKAIMYGMEAGTSVDQFKAGISTPVTVYNNGTEVTSGLVGTGMTVVYNDATYTLAVIGDLNGDGNVNVMDLAQMKSLILDRKASDLNLFVGDMNKDKVLSVVDIMAIKNTILRK